MNERWRLWLSLATGGAILAWLVHLVGTQPFLDGVRLVSGPALLAGTALTVVSTVAGAWRWQLVAAHHGIGLPWRVALPAYYRSLFLNATLPGGVLGDLHRAVRQGRDSGALGASLRAVWWERVFGQLTQLAVALGAGAVVVLRLDTSPAWLLPAVAVVLTLVVALVRPRWAPVVIASLVATAGYVAMVLIAAAAVGVSASAGVLIPVAVVMLVGSAVPANVAGWGPREGVAAWAFASIGVGVDRGVTVSVVYGVMTFVAALPGLVALLWRPAPVRERSEEVARG